MFRNLSPQALGVTGHQSEIIELALTFGFQGIDVDLGEFATRAKLKGMDYARRLIQSARLRIGSFPLDLDLESDEATFNKRLQRLAEVSQVAREAGCTRCTTTLPPASQERPYHENFEFFRQRLGVVAKTLEPAGVQLAVGFRAAESLRKGQPFQFIHDLDAMLLLLNMVPSSNVGLLLDVWDLHLAGGDARTVAKMRKGQVLAVEVANLPAGVAPADVNDTMRLLPDAENSVIDIPAILAALAGLGYEGPISPKPSHNIFANPRRDLIIKEAGESLVRVWKAAGLSPAGKLTAAARS